MCSIPESFYAKTVNIVDNFNVCDSFVHCFQCNLNKLTKIIRIS